jgi:hypothetical protein
MHALSIKVSVWVCYRHQMVLCTHWRNPFLAFVPIPPGVWNYYLPKRIKLREGNQHSLHAGTVAELHENEVTCLPDWGNWRSPSSSHDPEKSLTLDAKGNWRSFSEVVCRSCRINFFHSCFLLDVGLSFPWQLGSFLSFTEPLFGERWEELDGVGRYRGWDV